MTITFAKPNFAKNADHAFDVSDNWIDNVDVENERGAEVTAYFNSYDGVFELTGLCIADDLATTWDDRQGALKALTPETVRRIETTFAEAVA